MGDLPSTRSEARKCGSRYYFTGVPCKNGHIEKRRTSSCDCIGCVRDNSKNQRDKDKESSRAYYREYFKRNRDAHLKRLKNYREAYPDRVKKQKRNWYANNWDQYRDSCREWALRNRGKITFYRATYEADKLNRTPSWADHEAIQRFYDEAKRFSEETGVCHHVDHIIPLRGRLVSGLHVETNLQVIPASENFRKSNSFDPEMAVMYDD